VADSDMAIERYRPGRPREQSARETVRGRYPRATSAYVDNGAIVYDGMPDAVLGSASVATGLLNGRGRTRQVGHEA
jgi:hypothetical protein